MDDRLHQRNAGVTGQRSKARPDDGLAEDLPVLLGQPPAGAQPAARCDNDGCDASDHVLPVEDDVASWLSASRRRRKPAYRACRLTVDPTGDLLHCSTCAFGWIG